MSAPPKGQEQYPQAQYVYGQPQSSQVPPQYGQAQYGQAQPVYGQAQPIYAQQQYGLPQPQYGQPQSNQSNYVVQGIVVDGPHVVQVQATAGSNVGICRGCGREFIR